jgi:hypothetical protein
MDRRHDTFASPATVFEWRAVEEQPNPGFVERVLTEDERQRSGASNERIHLSETPLLDSRHVKGAHMADPPDPQMLGQHLVIDIEWTSEGRRLAKQATAARVGHKIAILLQGRVASVPTVREPVDSPEIQLSLGTTTPSEATHELLRALNPPLEPAADQPLRAPCASGHVPACQRLAHEYLRGRDLPFDPEAAFQSLQAACDHGHGESCRAAISILATHRLQSHEGEAVRMLRKGCDKKDLESCRALGELLAGDRHHPRPDTLEEGRALLRSACEGNVGKACYALGESIVRTDGKGDRKTLLSLLERSCLHGYARACEELGDLAMESTPPDRAAAIRWLTAGCKIDPEGLAYWRPCASVPGAEEREAIFRAAGCQIRPPVDCRQ